MRHPDYPFWSFIAMVLVILPLPWHLRARNIATLSLICWLFLANLVTFVNTLVWAGNYRDTSPVWCDISSRILLLLNYALPACSLAQMRRLESVASTRRSVISSKDRKRRLIEEITVCVIVPCICGVLYSVVQGHRYDLVENLGCTASLYVSVPGVIIRLVIPGAIAIASLIFAVLAVRWFLIRRLQFQTILAASNSSLSVGRYLRLIALAAVDSTVLLAYAIYNATSSFDTPLREYKSWHAVHRNFGQYIQYPEELIGSTYPAFVANAYAPFLYSIIFFTFFGFGEEATREYLNAGTWIVKMLRKLGIKRTSTGNQYESQQFTLGSKVIPAGDDAESFGERNDDSPSSMSVLEKRTQNGLPETDTRDVRKAVAVTVERSIV